MTLLKLTLLTLLSTTIYAQQSVQIDMHGGKEVKMPSLLGSDQVKKEKEVFYGKILEIKPAMGYQYLKIDEEGKSIWIAIANTPVQIGDKIGYDKETMMTNFQSKTLNQTFKEIYFVSDVYVPKKPSAPQSMKEMLGLNSTKPFVAPKTQAVTKPFTQKSSYTIEEIHMWRKELANQMVAVEATVTKVSHAIMKLDWVHLDDGTGQADIFTNDLIFTASSTNIKSGDKVIAKGRVIVDKDFGYGYFYKVLIEDATFEVK
ncbi:MAG: Unknown protein [uncultured Sulfurovum sp.]|uniref:NrfJ n=1 Tax=uncultured Sulfurovum sp. TaxID=269237 RepID=A0A6S6TS66_9BACT|nr:MAG: Unknown protein [uncultured Sulfurovum sp.]